MTWRIRLFVGSSVSVSRSGSDAERTGSALVAHALHEGLLKDEVPGQAIRAMHDELGSAVLNGALSMTMLTEHAH